MKYYLMRSAPLLVATAMLLFAFGCGGNHTLTPNTYAYVAVAGFNYSAIATMTQFKVASNGTLSPLNPEAFTSYGGGYSTLASDPSGRYIYAANSGEYTAEIQQFVVGSDGTITPNSRPEISAVAFPLAMVFTPNGQFAIVTNGLFLTSYSVDATGSLTLIETLSAGGNSNLSMAIDRSGRFLYVADAAYNGTISQYTISASGTLTLTSSIAVGNTSPWPIAMSPGGFLYSADGETGTVTEYSVNPSDGSLARVNSFPSGSGGPSGAINASWPCSIAFSPTGTHAYVSNCLNSTISGFTVDASNGNLTRSGPDAPLSSPFDSSLEARNIAVDPSGRFLFGPCDNGVVLTFTIDSNGMLTQKGSVSLANYGGAIAIVFEQR